MELDFQEQGELALAKEYAQVYRIVMELFDKFVELLGDEQISLKEYCELLDAGLEEAKVGVIPPSLDQLVIGDVERTRIKNIRALFFVGANDTLLPGNAGSRGASVRTGPGTVPGGEDCFVAGRKGADLYSEILSVSESDKTGGISVRILVQSIRSRENHKAGLSGTGHPPAVPRQSACRMKRKKPCRSGSLPPGRECSGWPEGSGTDSTASAGSGKSCIPGMRQIKKARPVFTGLSVRALRETIRSLWNRRRQSSSIRNRTGISVTRLEQFASCACAHFLRYGLKLSDREEYEFEALDLGNIAHQALERFLQESRPGELKLGRDAGRKKRCAD